MKRTLAEARAEAADAWLTSVKLALGKQTSGPTLNVSRRCGNWSNELINGAPARARRIAQLAAWRQLHPFRQSQVGLMRVPQVERCHAFSIHRPWKTHEGQAPVRCGLRASQEYGLCGVHLNRLRKAGELVTIGGTLRVVDGQISTARRQT